MNTIASLYRNHPLSADQHAAGLEELRGAVVLLVDDNPDVHAIVTKILSNSGALVHSAHNVTQAREIAVQIRIDAALVDMMIAEENGIDLIRHMRRIRPDAALVVITGFADRSMAVMLEEAGVHSVLTKPFSSSQLRFTLCKELMRCRAILGEGSVSAQDADASESGLVGKSHYMRELRQRVRMLAQGEIPVLIQGPTGTGKEIISRAMHSMSRRRNREMMIVNSSAIPEHLEESEFFGHAKGAFTGAHENKTGIIKCADGSTLFLDEVGDLSLRMQAKLLRVLDGHDFYRVGDTVAQRSDFRLVSATNRPLESMIAQGTFREDLYYRLKSGLILTRPLSFHREDISALVEHFLAAMQERESRTFLIAGGAMDLLLSYNWPGNIRELRNTVSSLCTNSMNTGIITRENIEWVIQGKRKEGVAPQVTFTTAKAEFEKNYFRMLLQKHGGNISKCAREADIERAYLSKRLKAFGIDPGEFKHAAENSDDESGV